MDERMRFVIRLKDGESMASLCREFGISRKTGYKIFERYEQCGLEGLSVLLWLAANGSVISREAAFHDQFLDVPIGKREPQIPTDRANNDLGFELPPFKQGWLQFGHRLAAYQTSRAPFVQHNCWLKTPVAPGMPSSGVNCRHPIRRLAVPSAAKSGSLALRIPSA
jgi:hypothetical protein